MMAKDLIVRDMHKAVDLVYCSPLKKSLLPHKRV